MLDLHRSYDRFGCQCLLHFEFSSFPNGKEGRVPHRGLRYAIVLRDIGIKAAKKGCAVSAIACRASAERPLCVSCCAASGMIYLYLSAIFGTGDFTGTIGQHQLIILRTEEIFDDWKPCFAVTMTIRWLIILHMFCYLLLLVELSGVTWRKP